MTSKFGTEPTSACEPRTNIKPIAAYAPHICVFFTRILTALPTGSFTQNHCQRFAKISRGDPFQVKGWNQGIDAGSPTHILRQNCTGKAPLVAMPDRG